MDYVAREESTKERADRRYGEQAGADRLGGSLDGTGLPRCSRHRGCVARFNRDQQQVLPPRSAPDE